MALGAPGELEAAVKLRKFMSVSSVMLSQLSYHLIITSACNAEPVCRWDCRAMALAPLLRSAAVLDLCEAPHSRGDSMEFRELWM